MTSAAAFAAAARSMMRSSASSACASAGADPLRGQRIQRRRGDPDGRPVGLDLPLHRLAGRHGLRNQAREGGVHAREEAARAVNALRVPHQRQNRPPGSHGLRRSHVLGAVLAARIHGHLEVGSSQKRIEGAGLERGHLPSTEAPARQVELVGLPGLDAVPRAVPESDSDPRPRRTPRARAAPRPWCWPWPSLGVPLNTDTMTCGRKRRTAHTTSARISSRGHLDSVSSADLEKPKSTARVKNCSPPSMARAATSSLLRIIPSPSQNSVPIRFWPPSPRVSAR